MAEKDWYGPFGVLTEFTPRHWQGLIAVTAGVWWIVAGIAGYDLGRRVADEVYETRWMGRVIWAQIGFGLALLGYAYYCYRKIRSAKQQRN
jgi:membrane protein DedA with SNARE-associated domain